MASRGAVLARHESDFRISAEDTLIFDELLQLLGTAAESKGRSREDAIACYLSVGEGWREAVKLLDGAFVERAEGLTERKVD